MEKNREILADRAKALFQHGLRGGADDDVVAVGIVRPSSSSRTAPPTM
jgi:hypothetical protein